MNKINYIAAAVCVLAALAVSLGGCSKPRPDGLPKLVPCSVTIIQDGKPLEEATVSFESEDLKWAVGGTTDAKGVAKIYSHGAYEGSPEGKFKVTVTKQVVEADQEATSASSTPISVAYNLVDLQYFTAQDTPLEIEVSGKTKKEFDVGSAIKEPVKMISR